MLTAHTARTITIFLNQPTVTGPEVTKASIGERRALNLGVTLQYFWWEKHFLPRTLIESGVTVDPALFDAIDVCVKKFFDYKTSEKICNGGVEVCLVTMETKKRRNLSLSIYY